VQLLNNILTPSPVPADYQKDYLPLKELGLILSAWPLAGWKSFFS